MTPHPPQVMSCDSCKFAENVNSRSYPKKCMVSKPIPMMVCKECVAWFAYVGCASHSSAASGREQVLDELRIIVCELYDDGFKDPLVTFDAAVNKLHYGNLKIHQQGEQQ